MMNQSDATVKRICLFAGFSPKQKIEDYVLFYLKALSDIADVYYCADNDLPESEATKISDVVKGVFTGKHSKYDFGSWGKIIDSLGWDFIETYDELILANDSCFGPLFPLLPIFEKMEALDCDAWGLAKNKFIMSFFLCIKRTVFSDAAFRSFFKELSPSQDKSYFVQCEKRLSGILSTHKTASLLDKKDIKTLYKKHKSEIKAAFRKIIPLKMRLFMRMRTNKIRLYDNEALFLPFFGFPFLKKNAFYMMGSVIPLVGLDFVKRFTDYDPNLISAVVEEYRCEKPGFWKYLSVRLNATFAQNKRHLIGKKTGMKV